MNKKVQKFIASLLLSSMALSTVAFAERDIKVNINGNPVEFDVPPTIKEERTFVPMRKIFETLGCAVEWVDDEQIIFATIGSRIMVMQLGNNKINLTDVISNEDKSFEMDVLPFIEDGRTLVPLRCISEALDCKVDWDDETSTVTITK